MNPSPPRSFSIHACLGRGGFGEVYRAEMHRPGGVDAEVALKVLRRDVGLNGQAVQRLRDEGKLLARLSHPAILKVHDLLILEGRVALVTEYVDGEDLSECIVGANPMPLRALLEVISQVAGALHVAWTSPIGDGGGALRMVHRDIKPSNIRIGRRGVVKLLDFGIARTDEVTREARTMTDMLVGSPPYMAPERFLDDAVEPASDVFALGTTLAEGVIGKRVFDVPVTMLAGLAVDADRFSKFVDDRLDPMQAMMPAPVFALIRSAMAHSPDDRPTAEDLARACDRLADKVGGASLTRWAKDRAWAGSTEDPGELDGRMLTEGTLEEYRPTFLPVATTLTESAGPSRVNLFMGGMSMLALFGSAGFVVLALLLVGLAVWQPWVSNDVASVAPAVETPVEAPEPSVAPEPTPAEQTPEVVPEPEPAPAPVASPSPTTRPKPAPEAAPSARPVVPKPAPSPEPEPEAARVARVATQGDPARMRRGATVIELPADVPEGTYTVEIFMGGKWSPVLEGVSVRAGQPFTVKCGNWTCRVLQ